MPDGNKPAHVSDGPRPELPRGLYVGVGALVASLFAAILLPKSWGLAAFGDILQLSLVGTATIVVFRNFSHSHSRVRIFWFLIFAGLLLWTISDGIWAVYELGFARLVPDILAVDGLLFVKMVPLTAALAIAPDREPPSHFRAFGLIDVSVLMIYSLYLFAFGVWAYLLLPGAQANYALNFDLADAIANQTLVLIAGIALLRSDGPWRKLYWLYFSCAACYALGSNLSNFATDSGQYYTGSIYNMPLIAALAGFLCVGLRGQTVAEESASAATPKSADATCNPATFLAENVAMLVTLSTPVIGIWVLSNHSMPPQLRSFRLVITLVTILLLMLLLSIKEDILAGGLFQSLQQLSETYGRIDRFQTHLTQSEKLAALGQLVASVANQIKGCMAAILETSSRLTSQPAPDSRIPAMAGKIQLYAQRTDVLLDNMLRFAQETPVRLIPLDIKPVLESALHLSRIAKLPHIRLDVIQEDNCPLVRGDSGQLLQVLLQLISNAVDSLDEAGGGTLQITLRPAEAQLLLEFADSGPGIKEPQRVFEPFYTTKAVGKGTGLGLSTCYGIIQQHDGEISCRNRPEGGAVFLVQLPLAQELAGDLYTETLGVLAEGVR